MASIYTKSMQILNAEQFKTAIADNHEPYVYFTFGKVDSWPNESSPTTPVSSVDTFQQVWKNMIGAKKIQGNDVRLAIRRFDWTSGTVYTVYSASVEDLDMNDPTVKFYVVTDEWNVYKCLGNNNESPSTVKPTGINTYIAEQTSDKYLWKYMYTLTDEEKLRFTTANYIPVRTLTEDNGSLQWHVQQNAIQGAIGSVRVTNPGSGYSPSVLPIITITGDGSGAEAVASVNATTTGIDSIIITNKGKDYTYANVAIAAILGSEANARVVLSPPGGHGSDPVEELGGSFVIINPRLKGSEDGILDIQNETRQISLLKNPVLYDGITLASDLVYSQTAKIQVINEGDNYVEDEYVYQGTSVDAATFKGKVVSWNSTDSILNLINVYGTLETKALIGDTSKASHIAQNSINQSFKLYTGTLLYINNITPIQRAADQTEDFKIVVSF